MRLRRQCAWCLDVLDEGDPGAETTHTCCDACFADWLHSDVPFEAWVGVEQDAESGQPRERLTA